MLRLPLLKTYSAPRICGDVLTYRRIVFSAYAGDDPVPGKRVKAATKLSSFGKMVPIVLGATGVLRLAELSRPNQRRRND